MTLGEFLQPLAKLSLGEKVVAALCYSKHVDGEVDLKIFQISEKSRGASSR